MADRSAPAAVPPLEEFPSDAALLRIVAVPEVRNWRSRLMTLMLLWRSKVGEIPADPADQEI